MKRENFNGPSTDVICTSCGYEKEMYYVPWCSVCDKPQRKSVETLNLIQALRHIEVITFDCGTKEKFNLDSYHSRMWTWMCESEMIPGNDSFKKFWRPDDIGTKDCRLTEQQQKDIQLFCDTFDITDKGVLLEISW